MQDFLEEISSESNKKLDIYDAFTRVVREEYSASIIRFFGSVIGVPINVFAMKTYMARLYKWNPSEYERIRSFYGDLDVSDGLHFQCNFWNKYHTVVDLKFLLRFYDKLQDELKATQDFLSKISNNSGDLKELENRVLIGAQSLSETCGKLFRILKWKVSHYQNEFKSEELDHSWPELDLEGSQIFLLGRDSERYGFNGEFIERCSYRRILDKCIFFFGLLGYFGKSQLATSIQNLILNSELIGMETLGLDLKEHFLFKINKIKNKEEMLMKRTKPLENEIAELSEKIHYLELEREAEREKLASVEESRDSLQKELSTKISENQALLFKRDKAKARNRDLREELSQQNIFSSFK